MNKSVIMQKKKKEGEKWTYRQNMKSVVGLASERFGNRLVPPENASVVCSNQIKTAFELHQEETQSLHMSACVI